MLFSKKTEKTSMSDMALAALEKTHAIVWLEPDGTILEANPNFHSIFGYASAELNGQDFDKLVKNGQIDEDFWTDVENNAATSDDFAYCHKDGSALYLEASFTAIGGGRRILIARDVTATKAAATQSNSLRAALESTHAIVEYDLEGNILRANANFFKTTGYSPDKVVGAHRNMFVIDADGDQAFWSRLVAGRTSSGVHQRRAKSNQTQWLQESYWVTEDAASGTKKIVALVNDITQTIEDQKKPAGSDFGATVAAVELNVDGKILEASNKFLGMCGYQSDEIVGKAYSSFFDNSDFASEFQTTFSTASSCISPFKTKSGEIRWYRNEIFRVEDKQNFLMSAVDVTEWKSESDALADALVKMKDGYLDARLPKAGAKEWRKLREAFNAFAATFQDLLSQCALTTNLILDETGSIAESSQSLSQRCEQQAASVEETSASMEEVSSSVKSNAKNAKDATEAATMATDFAHKGQKIVKDAISAMNKIEDGSSEVRKIIEVIDAIAFQTNLLALNAGVEAARAGDAGRGFAVVASEVRALAQRASDSARDINELIESSGAQVKEGSEFVNQTGDALNEIVDAVARVSAGIEGIFAASTEQSEVVQEINQAILNIDSTTQKTAAIAEESTASAALLFERANELKAGTDFFKLGNEPVRETKAAPSTTEKPAPIPPAIEESDDEPPAPPKPARSAAKAPPATDGALALQTADDDGWDEF